ncbi:unnamed protein product, partial [marine sediment metagenome]
KTYTKEIVGKETNNFGCYELLATTVNVHYIGEGKVRDQLLSHFNGGNAPCPGTKFYRVEYTGSKEKAVQKQNALLKAYEKKYGRLPKYNQKKHA